MFIIITLLNNSDFVNDLHKRVTLIFKDYKNNIHTMQYSKICDKLF